MGKILIPMPADLMAPDPPVFHNLIPGTVKVVFQRAGPGQQRCGRSKNLKRGSRLISVIDALIPPHLVQCVLFLFFCHQRSIFSRIQNKRIIQVKFRHIYAGIDFSILRVHNQYRNIVRLLCFHDLQRLLLRIGLNIIVQADYQIVAGHRLHPLLFGILDLDASGVRQSQDRPRDSLQILVIHDLQSDDSLIVAACESQNLGGQFTIGIVAFEIFIHFYACIMIGTDSIPHFLIHVGLDPFYRTYLLHPVSHRFFRQSQFLTKHLYHRFRIFDLTVNHGDGADCPVISQYRTGPVDDPSPGGLDAPLPLMKILRQFLVIF